MLKIFQKFSKNFLKIFSKIFKILKNPPNTGVNPVELRGSRTGVFVGCSASETGGALTQDPDIVTGYTLTGCVRSMFSNRLSFAFDLRGPSFSVDTACSSSLLAMQLAIDAIRQEQCDAAIVAG